MRLNGELTQYRVMAQEYSALLNYMITMFGQNDTIVIDREAMLKIEMKPVRTELIRSALTGKMTGQRFSRILTQPTEEHARIIKP